MSEHTPQAGHECFFYEWTGAEYVQHRAIITNILSGNPLHPNVNLRYSDGAAAPVAANVPNIETAVIGTDDYWRPNRVTQPFIPPFQNSVPAQGSIVWAFVFDVAENDHFERIAFVRAVQGTPAVDSTLNLTIWNPTTGDAINVNGVESLVDYGGDKNAAAAVQADFWVDRILGPGEESV